MHVCRVLIFCPFNNNKSGQWSKTTHLKCQGKSTFHESLGIHLCCWVCGIKWCSGKTNTQLYLCLIEWLHFEGFICGDITITICLHCWVWGNVSIVYGHPVNNTDTTDKKLIVLNEKSLMQRRTTTILVADLNFGRRRNYSDGRLI